MIRLLVVGTFTSLLLLPCATAGDKELRKIPGDARYILERADSFELLSLEPERVKDAKETFQGWKVLGKKVIDKAEMRKKLVDEFERGVAEYTGGAAKCFNPRHGIRVKHDGKSADFVICFECDRVLVYAGGKDERLFLVSQTPGILFNKVLKEAGVPLPKGPKD
jgi:hypothetical protein